MFLTTDFDSFVSPEYIENESQSSQWKDFFSQLKMDEKIKILRYKGTFTHNSINQCLRNYFAYVELINQIPCLDKNQEFFIDNAIILHYYEGYQFLFKLWKYLIENWDSLAIVPNATVFITGNQQYSVLSPFEYDVVMGLSIPCTDGRCYSPIAVYSHSLKSDLVGCDLPVSAINFPAIIEEFAGIKRSLDVNACLEILKRIASSLFLEQETKQLLSIYEKLSNLIKNGVSNSAQYYINKWKSNGQLLACDNLLHPIGELYYIDSELDLPYNHNSKLVTFPENQCNQAAFKSFLGYLGVNKIIDADIQIIYDNRSSCQIVPNQ